MSFLSIVLLLLSQFPVKSKPWVRNVVCPSCSILGIKAMWSGWYTASRSFWLNDFVYMMRTIYLMGWREDNWVLYRKENGDVGRGTRSRPLVYLALFRNLQPLSSHIIYPRISGPSFRFEWLLVTEHSSLWGWQRRCTMASSIAHPVRGTNTGSLKRTWCYTPGNHL